MVYAPPLRSGLAECGYTTALVFAAFALLEARVFGQSSADRSALVQVLTTLLLISAGLWFSLGNAMQYTLFKMNNPPLTYDQMMTSFFSGSSASSAASRSVCTRCRK